MQKSKISDHKLSDIVKSSRSYSEVIRKGGFSSSGSVFQHIQHRILKLKLDISHFKGKGSNCGNHHVGGCEKKTYQEILVRNNSSKRERGSQLRRAFTEFCHDKKIPIKCIDCGNYGVWNNQTLKLEIHHENGNRSDNTPENLKWVCPNCHSLKNGTVCKSEKQTRCKRVTHAVNITGSNPVGTTKFMPLNLASFSSS